jgi:hypothetical protein
LSRKYSLLAANCSDSSKIYASCAADIFSPPKRLKTQYDIFTNDPEIDWTASGRTIFYDILTSKTFLHDVTRANRKNDGSNRAMRLEIMRNLPVIDRKAGVDGWIWKESINFLNSIGKEFKPCIDIVTDNWKYGLNVHGLNNISHHRTSWFHSPVGRPVQVTKCPIDINKTIPPDIIEKLYESRKFVRMHKIGLP